MYHVLRALYNTFINLHRNLGDRYPQYYHFAEEIIEAEKLKPKVIQLKTAGARFDPRQFTFKADACYHHSLSPLFIFRTLSLLSFSLITLGGLNTTFFDAEPHFSIANK